MPTVDSDLIANFQPDEIHLVTSPDEMTALELSPRSKASGSRDMDQPPARSGLTPMGERYAKQHLEHGVYRWALSHRIIICGQAVDCGDGEAVKGLLK